MIEYEYKIVILGEWNKEAILNDYGKEGWELVTVADRTAYFIRVVNDDIEYSLKEVE